MKTALIFSAVLLVAIAASAAHLSRPSKVENTPASNAASSVPVDPPAMAQSGESEPSIKLVLLELRPEGFEPNEIQLQAGEYMWMIRNRTGLDEVKLSLNRAGNERVTTATAHSRLRDWKQRMKLTPGTYVFSAPGYPDWTCRVVVAP
jgi:hypothetical protein